MVESVEYLGLPNHPLHELASKYMWLVDAEHDELYRKPVNRYGHLMSFCVKGGAEKARKVFDGLQRIWRATDLGRIKSVATIPAISTHQQQGEEGRKLAGIPPQPDPALRRRRAPRRHHRGPRPGAGPGPLTSRSPVRMPYGPASVPARRRLHAGPKSPATVRNSAYEE